MKILMVLTSHSELGNTGKKRRNRRYAHYWSKPGIF